MRCFIKASAGVMQHVLARLPDNEKHTGKTGITTVILERRSQDTDFSFFLRVEGKIGRTVVIRVIIRQTALFLREKNCLTNGCPFGFLPILPMASSEAAEGRSRSHILSFPSGKNGLQDPEADVSGTSPFRGEHFFGNTSTGEENALKLLQN
jgi:hypothetical protein